ncbi:MFS transporter [Alphaproteobacteria bacterium LSUCC0684]
MLQHIQHKSVRDIFINISHFLDHFMMLIFAKAAYDAARHFGIGYQDIISYGTLGFVLFGAMAPVSARLADRYSRSLMMVIFHFGIGVAAILASQARTLDELMAGLALIGIFASIFHPVGIAMLLRREGRVGLRLGINGVFGNMGVAAAPLIVGVLLLLGDWRVSFWVCGGVCLAYGIIFILALRPETRATASGKNTGQATSGFSRGWLRALLALGLSTTAGGFIFGAMTFLVPRYFEISMTSVSVSVAVTGLLASIVYAVASFAQIGVGWLIDRGSPRMVLFCMATGQGIFLYAASQFTDLALMAVMTMAMSFVFGQIPITDAIMVRYVPDEWRGRILSIKFLLNLSVGASVLPLCAMLLQNGYSMANLFMIMSATAALIMAAALFLPSQGMTKELQEKTA